MAFFEGFLYTPVTHPFTTIPSFVQMKGDQYFLTSNAMQGNAWGMWEFLLHYEEMVEIEPRKRLSGSFRNIFCLCSFTPHELCHESYIPF